MEVSLNDVSAIIRLVREVCDRWDDPAAWRERLLAGACTLLGGSAGTILADYQSQYGWFGKISVVSVVGIPESMKAMVQSSITQMDQRQIDDVSENLMPGMTRLNEEMVRQGWATVAWSQIADREAYHASPFYLNFRKKIDVDDSVVSVRMVDEPRRPEAISIDRPMGSEAFGAREVALLKLLHDEIAPLVGVRLATEEHISRDGLSKRLRETLSLLLEGYSEKQVANELKLGTRTVHDYVTMLYKHFRVSSRAELLAYFIRRIPVARGEGQA